MEHALLTLEWLWVHFAVYARAFTASIRQVHDDIDWHNANVP